MGRSPYTDMERPPLSETALRRALLGDGALWTALDYRMRTGSTNADVASAARDGTAEGYVVVADEQTAGRGRLDRAWYSPPRAGLAVSVLLRPGRAVPARGWSPVAISGYGAVPLLAGVALVEAVRRIAEVDATLKWPNDLLIDGRKCAGVLAETVPERDAGGAPTEVTPAGVAPAVVVGIGLNVTLREPELPRADATSLQLAGATCVDRDPVLRAVLRGIAEWYVRWRDAGGDPVESGVVDTYRLHCTTIGRPVRVSLPDGTEVAGIASGVDDNGALVIDGRRIAAGDVAHVRAG
ncbi:MAG TPA: biotin--[acetyl-CoA-carboxylase] ligase [Micromonosporaceae bacterium]|nr:biotin--[acetyl-CoA-carboxylase] ligase [Micromonosporaceae bacterium]